jgi:hypothetical protein
MRHQYQRLILIQVMEQDEGGIFLLLMPQAADARNALRHDGMAKLSAA